MIIADWYNLQKIVIHNQLVRGAMLFSDERVPGIKNMDDIEMLPQAMTLLPNFLSYTIGIWGSRN